MDIKRKSFRPNNASESEAQWGEGNVESGSRPKQTIPLKKQQQ